MTKRSRGQLGLAKAAVLVENRFAQSIFHGSFLFGGPFSEGPSAFLGHGGSNIGSLRGAAP